MYKRDAFSPSDRLAGSDFQVAAGQTAAIRIGLTTLGARLVSAEGGYRGDLYVLLRGAGFVDANYPQPTLELNG